MDFLLPVCFKLPKYCSIMSTNDDDGMISTHNRPTMVCESLQAPQRVLLSEVTPGFLQSGSLVDVHVFSFKELAAVTGNFSCQLGVGGFGPVYMGLIDDGLRTGLKAQPVAVKVLDLERSTQGHREWLAEVVLLGQLKHPNVVNLIGYCCENKDRLLVYEYMEGGNLHTHLFQTLIFCSPTTLSWLARLKIALGAAAGLAFLHHQEKPAAAVIFRDFKSSNILLDSEYNAKLSDFGLATDGPQDGHTHVSTCVMGTEGYTAPEYIMTGHLTTMSDVFSFGVVLLELLTGRRSVDKNRQGREKVLVDWGMPRLKDPCKLHCMMDPRLEGQYSTIGARKLAALAHKCLSTNPKSRPNMSSVVKALEPMLHHSNDIPIGPFVYVAPGPGPGPCPCPSPTQPRNVELKNMENKLDGGNVAKEDNKLREEESESENCRRRQRNARRFLRRVTKPRNHRLVYSDSELYVIQKTKYHKTS